MKQYRALLLIYCLLLFTGCQRTQKVGICARADAQYTVSLTQALTDAGYRVEAVQAGLDQAVQTRQVQTLLETCDLLILEPVMMEEAAALATMAQKADVPVIFTGHRPDRTLLDSWDGFCYIGVAEETAGNVQGQLCGRFPNGCDLNGDGLLSYCVVAGAEGHLDTLTRTQGVMDTLAGNCLEVVCTDWSRDSAAQACGRLLARWGKDMEAVVCNSDILAMGAMDALAHGGRTVNADVYLFGLGGERQALLLVRSGKLSGTVRGDYAGLTQALVTAAQALLQGREVEKQTCVPYGCITADNVGACL